MGCRKRGIVGGKQPGGGHSQGAGKGSRGCPRAPPAQRELSTSGRAECARPAESRRPLPLSMSSN